jgi:hypothetical protein
LDALSGFGYAYLMYEKEEVTVAGVQMCLMKNEFLIDKVAIDQPYLRFQAHIYGRSDCCKGGRKS